MGSDRMSIAKRRGSQKRIRLWAFILSLFIPGAGHFMRGRWGMGIMGLILDAGFFFFAHVMLSLRPDLSWLLWPLWILAFAIFYVLVAWDAYKGPVAEKAPCTRACPAGIRASDYVALVAAGRHAESEELIREKAAFVGTLGRLCPAPCEDVCTRTRIEEPIAIRALKRSAVSGAEPFELTKSTILYPGYKVAVVGAGPSGLTCAHFLARRGYRVDVFDRESEPGGLLCSGIPCFRLPRQVLKADIDLIFQANPGIRFHGEMELGGKLSLEELEESYDAVYLAFGASKARPLYLEGEGLRSVWSGFDFLSRVCKGVSVPSFEGHVAVLGGGNTAVDSARSALRLGAAKVTVFYRRSRKHMPAYADDVLEAEREGVQFVFLAAPLKFEGHKKVNKIRLGRMRLADQKLGRLSPLLPLEHEEWAEEVEAVIVAVGQEPDPEVINRLPISTDVDQRLIVNPRTLQTKCPRVFAGGDLIRGGGTVVEAVRDGFHGAREIDYFLRPRPLGRHLSKLFPLGKFIERMADFDLELGLEKLEGAAWRKKKPQVRPRQKEKSDYEDPSLYKETRLGLGEHDQDEGKRCLRCQRFNMGFAYRKGKQKGYLPPDER